MIVLFGMAQAPHRFYVFGHSEYFSSNRPSAEATALGYGDYDTPQPRVEPIGWWPRCVGVLTDCLTLLVRGVGLILLVVGLWVAVEVVVEA